MEITQRLLSSVPTLHSVQLVRGLCSKLSSSSYANMARQPRLTTRSKALSLACCNAYGCRGRKEERDHFLGLYGIDICLLTETRLRSGEVFRMVNYVCHRNGRLTERGGTAILLRHVMDHRAVPVQVLEHLDATAIQVMMADKRVIIVAVYLSPTRPLIASNLSASFGGSFFVLMGGDLNA